MAKLRLTGKAWRAKVPTWAKMLQTISAAWALGGNAYFQADQAGPVSLFGVEWTVSEQWLVHNLVSLGFVLFLQFIYEDPKNSANHADAQHDSGVQDS